MVKIGILDIFLYTKCLPALVIADPELTINIYCEKGYNEEWISQRLIDN